MTSNPIAVRSGDIDSLSLQEQIGIFINFCQSKIRKQRLGRHLVGTCTALANKVYNAISERINCCVLMVGYRGSGKNFLVAEAISIITKKINQTEIKTIYVDCQNSGLAIEILLNICTQLGLNDAGDNKTYTLLLDDFKNKLKVAKEFLRPVVIVLKRIHCLGVESKALLYDLFDLTQNGDHFFILIGITHKADFLRTLDKRIISRIASNVLTVPNPTADIICQELATRLHYPLQSSITQNNPPAASTTTVVRFHDIVHTWNQQINAMFGPPSVDTAQTEVETELQKITGKKRSLDESIEEESREKEDKPSSDSHLASPMDTRCMCYDFISAHVNYGESLQQFFLVAEVLLCTIEVAVSHLHNTTSGNRSQIVSEGKEKDGPSPNLTWVWKGDKLKWLREVVGPVPFEQAFLKQESTSHAAGWIASIPVIVRIYRKLSILGEDSDVKEKRGIMIRTLLEDVEKLNGYGKRNLITESSALEAIRSLAEMRLIQIQKPHGGVLSTREFGRINDQYHVTLLIALREAIQAYESRVKGFTGEYQYRIDPGVRRAVLHPEEALNTTGAGVFSAI